MPRPEKVQAVADIKERIAGSQAVFLAEYAGLSVKDQQTLRRELRANGAEFKVVKMTLARLAAADLDIDSLDELLLGPTGLAFSDGDPVTAAKALKNFAKDHDVFVIKGGLLGDEFVTPETISKLADIEPRDVLLAKLAGAMKAPMANLAGLMAALPRNTASVLQQLLEKKEQEAPVPDTASSGDDVAASADDDGAPDTEALANDVEETEEDESADAEASNATDKQDVTSDDVTEDSADTGNDQTGASDDDAASSDDDGEE
ncbi:MAG: 50S ribosomal protein L10 [Acidimicrobiia bacterium]|nr:50S ribosomal protein L10 [Acidimicrobiia bacterium]